MSEVLTILPLHGEYTLGLGDGTQVPIVPDGGTSPVVILATDSVAVVNAAVAPVLATRTLTIVPLHGEYGIGKAPPACPAIEDQLVITAVLTNEYSGYYPSKWGSMTGMVNFPDIRVTENGLPGTELHAICNNGASYNELVRGEFWMTTAALPGGFSPNFIVPAGERKKVELTFEIAPNITFYELERNGPTGTSTAFALFFNYFYYCPLAVASSPDGLLWISKQAIEPYIGIGELWAELPSGQTYTVQAYIDNILTGTEIATWGVIINNPLLGLGIDEPGRIVKLHSVRMLLDTLNNPVAEQRVLDTFTEATTTALNAHTTDDGKTWTVLLDTPDATDTTFYVMPVVTGGTGNLTVTDTPAVTGIFRLDNFIGVNRRIELSGSWDNYNTGANVRIFVDWNGIPPRWAYYYYGLQVTIAHSSTNIRATVTVAGAEIYLDAYRGSAPYSYTFTLQESATGWTCTLVAGATVTQTIKKGYFEPVRHHFVGVSLFKNTLSPNTPYVSRILMTQTAGTYTSMPVLEYQY